MSEDPSDAVEAYRMTLVDHLRELRNRLVIAAVSVITGMVVCLFVFNPLYEALTMPMRIYLEGQNLDTPIARFYLAATAPLRGVLTDVKFEGTLALSTGPLEGMYTYLRVAVIGGCLLASPVVAYQVWRFVAPGLYPSERRYVMPLSLASTGLFLLGAGFAYFVIFPVAFPFFFGIVDAAAIVSVEGYLKAVVWIMLAFGICFQMPVAAFFMARIGLVDHRDLMSAFRIAIVAIFAVAALITPPDVVTQVLLGIPLVGLYGVSVLVARVFTTKVRTA